MKSLVFIYGQDTWRIRERLREIVSEIKTRPKGFLVIELDLANVTLEELSEELRQDSLFGQGRLFILRNAFVNHVLFEYLSAKGGSAPGGKSSAARALTNKLTGHVIVICEESEPKNTDKLFRFLEKSADVYYYPLLKGRFLVEWIELEAKRCGGKIDGQAASYLVDCFGPDTWRLNLQIKRLAAFKKGESISIGDAELFVRPEAKTVIFHMLDAISAGSRAEGLNLLRAHLAKGESPFYLMAMISYQIRNMLLAKEISANKISLQESGLHPYVFRKLIATSRRFSADELKKIHRKIFKMDREMKLGLVEPVLALELLFADI